MNYEDYEGNVCGYLPVFEESTINFSKFLLDFTEMIERTSKVLNGHLHRVAFIAWHVGEALGLGEGLLKRLAVASLLHDVGLLFVIRINYLKDLWNLDRDALIDHGELSRWVIDEMDFLEDNAEIAEIVRYHHVTYHPSVENNVPFESMVLMGADHLEIAIRRYEYPWLHKDEIISQLRKSGINPEVLSALEGLVKDSPLAFWYSMLVSRRAVREFLEERLGSIPIKSSQENLLKISGMIGHVVDFRSPVTSTHSTRVAALAEAIAEKMDLCIRKRFLLRLAGLLHDVGKMMVPIEILEKPARLDPKEYALIQTHVYYTYRFLKHVGMPVELVEAASYHHERLDGSGYPFGVTSDCLYTGAKIMQIADVFAALSEKRPYKERWDKELVISVLEEEVKAGRLCSKVYSHIKPNFDELYQVAEEAALSAKVKFESFLENVAMGKEKLTEVMGI